MRFSQNTQKFVCANDLRLNSLNVISCSSLKYPKSTEFSLDKLRKHLSNISCMSLKTCYRFQLLNGVCAFPAPDAGEAANTGHDGHCMHRCSRVSLRDWNHSPWVVRNPHHPESLRRHGTEVRCCRHWSVRCASIGSALLRAVNWPLHCIQIARIDQRLSFQGSQAPLPGKARGER